MPKKKSDKEAKDKLKDEFKIKPKFATGNFKKDICMYINDCKQYLKAALSGKPVDMMSEEFNPTQDEFLIIYGMKELKDLSMQLAGRKPLDWKDWRGKLG